MTTTPAPQTAQTLPPAIEDLPLTLSVRVGTAKRSIRELMTLNEGSLVVLGTRIDEPVEICLEDRVIARGELIDDENAEDGLAVRITELLGT